MKKIIQTPLILLFAALALIGCRSLDPAGPYKGDSKLYAQDVGIRAAYDTIHTFVTWESQNRAALKSNPDIKKAADVMRKNTPKWMTTAIALRDAYASVPSTANLAALQQSLAVLKAAMTEASQYMLSATQ
jgi:hypothetical protein